MTHWDQLIDVLARFLDRNELSCVTRQTRVEEDLGISGDDAHDFLRDYSKMLNVDISAFDFRSYFSVESGILLRVLREGIFGRKRKSLTLGELEEAIKRGSLR